MDRLYSAEVDDSDKRPLFPRARGFIVTVARELLNLVVPQPAPSLVAPAPAGADAVNSVGRVGGTCCTASPVLFTRQQALADGTTRIEFAAQSDGVSWCGSTRGCTSGTTVPLSWLDVRGPPFCAHSHLAGGGPVRCARSTSATSRHETENRSTILVARERSSGGTFGRAAAPERLTSTERIQDNRLPSAGALRACRARPRRGCGRRPQCDRRAGRRLRRASHDCLPTLRRPSRNGPGRRRRWLAAVLSDVAQGTCSVLEHGYALLAWSAPTVCRPVGGRCQPDWRAGRCGGTSAYEERGFLVELDGRLGHNVDAGSQPRPGPGSRRSGNPGPDRRFGSGTARCSARDAGRRSRSRAVLKRLAWAREVTPCPKCGAADQASLNSGTTLFARRHATELLHQVRQRRVGDARPPRARVRRGRSTAWLPPAVVATSVVRPARRWNQVARRFQPITWSTSRIRRRRTSEPDRATRWPATRAWPSERVRSQASRAATGSATRPTSSHDGRVGEHRQRRTRRRRRERAAARGSSGVARRGARGRRSAVSTGLGRAEDLARRPARPPAAVPAGPGRSCPAGCRSRPVTIADSRAPRASRSPSGSERLTPATRSSSSVVSRVVSSPRRQVPGRGAGVRVSRKPQFVTTYPPIESSEMTTSTPSTSSGIRTASGTRRATSTFSGLNRSQKPTDLEHLAGGTERGRGDHHTAAGQRCEPHPGRVEGHARPARPRLLVGHLVVRGRGPQQLGAQGAGPVQRQPVEVDPVLVARRGGARCRSAPW